MSCPFYQTTLRTGRLPISATYDFDEPASSILLQGDEKDKQKIGNPIIPGSELPLKKAKRMNSAAISRKKNQTSERGGRRVQGTHHTDRP